MVDKPGQCVLAMLPPLPQLYWEPLPFPTQPIFSFKKSCEINMCCPNILECIVFCWRIVYSSGNSLFLSLQLTTVKSPIQIEVGFCTPFPCPWLSLIHLWLSQVFYVVSQPLWVHMNSCSAVSRCFCVVNHCVWVFTFFPPFLHNDPWHLMSGDGGGGGGWGWWGGSSWGGDGGSRVVVVDG